MNKQSFKLGQKVWCFKGAEEVIEKAVGFVCGAMINTAGRIQYSVKVWDKSGEAPILREWQTAEASMAMSEIELQEKINVYINFVREQRKNYDNTFGKEDFNLKELGDSIND